MPESGGTTTQSGIFYQNSLAALYLGRLCDPRVTPRNKQITEVRIEAPEYVDDIVITHVDGSKVFVQAKEALQVGGEPWKKFWASVEAQAREDKAERHEFLLVIGRYTPDLDALREGLDRSRGKEDFDEWHSALNTPQRGIIQRVCEALGTADRTVAFSILHRTFVEIRPKADIETAGVRDWIPPSNTLQLTLFSHLRDLCGAYARVRKIFRAPELIEELFLTYQIEIQNGSLSKTDEYRQALVREYSRIVVPGTSTGGPINELFLWPTFLDRSALSTERDFEEEDIHFRRVGPVQSLELNDFPNGKIKRAIVDAGAGLGKSTFLRALVHKLAQKPSYVPALVPLDLLTEHATVDEYLDNGINRLYRVKIDWLLLCETGRAALFFDGLDELADADRTQAVVKIERFAARYPSVPFLLAVRDSSILSPFDETQVLELQRLDYNSIATFVRQYLRAKPNIDPQELTNRLERHHDLWQLARIPLYLAILLSTLKPGEDVPTNRSEVLERYLSVLFNPDRYKEKNISSDDADSLRDAAEFLAYNALKLNAIGIEERDAKQQLKSERFAGSQSQTIQSLIQNGILLRRGTRLQFYFPILQEYLAAVWLVRNQPDAVIDSFQQIVRRPWAQTLQFALELHPQADKILRAQLSEPDDAFRTALRLIGRSILNGARVEASLQEEVGNCLVDAWWSRSHYIRISIGYILADGFSSPPSQKLKAALKNSSLGGYGREEILYRANDPTLTLDVLEAILAEDDIRDLWSRNLQSALAIVPGNAVEALLVRARRESGSTLSASVIASVLNDLLAKVGGDSWKKLTLDLTLPPVVRLAAFRSGPRPISRDALFLIDEVVTTVDVWGAAWEEIIKTYFEIDGWRGHLAEVAKGKRLPACRSLFPFLRDENSSVGLKPELKLFLSELVKDSEVFRNYVFEIYLALAESGDENASAAATAMLKELPEDQYFQWIEFSPILTPSDLDSGIHFIYDANLDRSTIFRVLHLLCIVLESGSSPSIRFPRQEYKKTLEVINPTLEFIVSWLSEILNHCTKHQERLEILANLFRLNRPEFGPQLESVLAEFMDAHPAIENEEWSAVAGAAFGAVRAGYAVNSALLWRIVYQYPSWPVGSIVDDIARTGGEQSHAALVECFNRHPSGDVKMSIFQYFERAAPRLGLRVTEESGQLKITRMN